MRGAVLEGILCLHLDMFTKAFESIRYLMNTAIKSYLE